MGQARGISLDHRELPGFSSGDWVYFYKLEAINRALSGSARL